MPSGIEGGGYRSPVEAEASDVARRMFPSGLILPRGSTVLDLLELSFPLSLLRGEGGGKVPSCRSPPFKSLLLSPGLDSGALTSSFLGP